MIESVIESVIEYRRCVNLPPVRVQLKTMRETAMAMADDRSRPAFVLENE